MTGADDVIGAAVEAGVGVCFANPGTTELDLVAALEHHDGMRSVLALQENVATGAADGYGRLAPDPALVLLHLGPGLANGLANLHNARRAHTPVVTLVGDHATWHRAADPPLASDIEGLARPMSVWVGAVRTRDACAETTRAAIDGARAGGPATLVVAQDLVWDAASGEGPAGALYVAAPPSTRCAVGAVMDALRRPGALLLLGGRALRAEAIAAAVAIGASTGCRVMSETFPPVVDRGAGIPMVPRLPYIPEQALQALAQPSVVVLAGASPPVAFFGYRGGPSRLLAPETEVLRLAGPADDGVVQLLVGLAGSDAQAPPAPAVELPARQGPITPVTFGAAVAAAQPEGAIVVEEAVTTGGPYLQLSGGAPPHRSLVASVGGAIGAGLPVAVGAAVAEPGRRVLALEADGSGMYTCQALWTMARERLDVTVVVAANGAYRILAAESRRAELAVEASSLLDLSRPDLDWVQLAGAMGVEAVSVDTAEALEAAIGEASAAPGPRLVEARIGAGR